jgi:hypothetical protein
MKIFHAVLVSLYLFGTHQRGEATAFKFLLKKAG